MMIRNISIPSWGFLLAAMTFLAYVQPAMAQQTQPVTPTPAAAAVNPAVPVDTTAVASAPSDAAAAASKPEVRPDQELNPNEIPSLLFTFWEHTAINDAKNSRGLVRPPTEDELMRDLKNKQADKVKPPPEEREIRLAGIVYVNAADWTIWLNGKRVTPKAIPKEIIDLKVSKEYVEMKWFDDYTNQIFPVRLRPHQRFNIDARIFLPG